VDGAGGQQTGLISFIHTCLFLLPGGLRWALCVLFPVNRPADDSAEQENIREKV
jgi:hypothetical protein